MNPLCFLLVLVAIIQVSGSQLQQGEPELVVHATGSSDLRSAVDNMRNKTYYGFAILLQMLNTSAQQNRPLTYLIPADKKSPIQLFHLEEFLTSHAISMPLSFNDLLHFPTGSLVPTVAADKMIRIKNRGRSSFYVNNAQIITPNICDGSLFRCLGIDAVIQYDNSTVTRDSKGPTVPLVYCARRRLTRSLYTPR